MEIPFQLALDLLEQELTEKKADELASKLSQLIAKKVGGIHGKLLGASAYGVIDAVTPELLFEALRSIFPADHVAKIASMPEDAP